MIFDQQLKIKNYFQKIFSYPPPPEKNLLLPFYLLPPLKIQKLQAPLFPNIENFLAPPCRNRGPGGGEWGRTLKGLQSSLNTDIPTWNMNCVILVKTFFSDYFRQYRSLKKKRIWLQKFLHLKVVTAVFLACIRPWPHSTWDETIFWNLFHGNIALFMMASPLYFFEFTVLTF